MIYKKKFVSFSFNYFFYLLVSSSSTVVFNLQIFLGELLNILITFSKFQLNLTINYNVLIKNWFFSEVSEFKVKFQTILVWLEII